LLTLPVFLPAAGIEIRGVKDPARYGNLTPEQPAGPLVGSTGRKLEAV